MQPQRKTGCLMNKRKWLLAGICLAALAFGRIFADQANPICREPTFPPGSVSISSFGAVADGHTLNTGAIAAAIAACSKAGGGTVTVPKGVWLTGPIHLRSNVRLYLAEGAELRFDPDLSLYPMVFSRHAGVQMQTPSPMVCALDCDNVGLAGPGLLNGQGKEWWARKGPLPAFVQFIRCRRVAVEDITLQEGPFWTLHLVYCEDAMVRRITIRTTGPNTDGVDIDSCRNVEVRDSAFATGDDCICIKSGAGLDGIRVNKPSENIVIHDCKMTRGGGIAFGGDLVGGIRNVRVARCDLTDTWVGICFKAEAGWGGILEDVDIEDIHVRNVAQRGLDMGQRYEPADDKESFPLTPDNYDKARCPKLNPIFRRIRIVNLSGDVGTEPIVIAGLPGRSIQNLTLEHVHLVSKRSAGITIYNVDALDLNDVPTAGQYPPLLRNCTIAPPVTRP